MRGWWSVKREAEPVADRPRETAVSAGASKEYNGTRQQCSVEGAAWPPLWLLAIRHSLNLRHIRLDVQVAELLGVDR